MCVEKPKLYYYVHTCIHENDQQKRKINLKIMCV